MPTYLERYLRGEYTQVWMELVALGNQVRHEPLHSDAYGVAQETMRRARHNVELLAERLSKLGYQFHESSQIFIPASPQDKKQLQKFERKVGAVPLSVRAWAEMVGSVNFMGSYPRLCYYGENSNPFMAIGGAFGGIQQVSFADLLKGMPFASKNESPSNADATLSALQGAFQKLTSQMGSTQKTKPSTPEIAEADRAISDPLVVDLTEIDIDSYEEWQEYEDENGPFAATIAPDIHHKSNISGSGGYEILLPNAAADAPLLYTDWGDLTFVEYLRLSFEWGGFPGLQDYERRDEALLASLKEGLLAL